MAKNRSAVFMNAISVLLLTWIGTNHLFRFDFPFSFTTDHLTNFTYTYIILYVYVYNVHTTSELRMLIEARSGVYTVCTALGDTVRFFRFTSTKHMHNLVQKEPTQIYHMLCLCVSVSEWNSNATRTCARHVHALCTLLQWLVYVLIFVCVYVLIFGEMFGIQYL